MHRIVRTTLRSSRSIIGAQQQAVRAFATIKKYTKTHEWIEVDTETLEGRMGISEHAAKELGDIVHVDLPDIGTEFKERDVVICVESVKTAADVYQMVDGEIIGINEDFLDDPELVNREPEENGWLV